MGAGLLTAIAIFVFLAADLVAVTEDYPGKPDAVADLICHAKL